MDRKTRTASTPEKLINSSNPPNPSVSSKRVLRSKTSEEWGLGSLACTCPDTSMPILSRVVLTAKPAQREMSLLLDEFRQNTHCTVYANHYLPTERLGTSAITFANWRSILSNGCLLPPSSSGDIAVVRWRPLNCS